MDRQPWTVLPGDFIVPTSSFGWDFMYATSDMRLFAYVRDVFTSGIVIAHLFGPMGHRIFVMDAVTMKMGWLFASSVKAIT
jgi:hypothetical protein